MTQAGTINLGGGAQTKRSGSLSPVIALTLALVLAMIGAVLFASNAGRVGGSAAKPVADWSYNQIEAQRGAIMLSTDAYLNGILDKAHATPYVAGTDEYLNGIVDRAHATPFAGAATTVQISATSGTFHATPATGGATAPLVSATSGTFHATPAVVGPAKRNHVGGPR